MIMSISTQIRLVIFSLTAGIITGVLFDFYRVIRGFANINRVVVFIEDMLFWTFAGISVFLFLLYANHAYTDMYVYLLIITGIFLYFKFVSSELIGLEEKVLGVIVKGLRIIINFVLYPFEIIIYCLKSKNNKSYKK